VSDRLRSTEDCLSVTDYKPELRTVKSATGNTKQELALAKSEALLRPAETVMITKFGCPDGDVDPESLKTAERLRVQAMGL